MKLYQAFEVDEETPVQYLAVHPLRWQEHWGEPAIMFREVDDETQALADAAPALLAACKLAKQHLDAMRLESGMGNVMLPFEKAAFEQVDRELTAAIAQAEGEQ